MSITRRGFLAITSSAGLVYAVSRLAQAQSAGPATNQNMQRADELLRQMTVEEKVM
jgi:hypothetical protein